MKNKWILLEQPINGWLIHQHYLTYKIKSFKSIKDKRGFYVWCPRCGWELTRNSRREKVIFNENTKSTLMCEKFICSRCGDTHIFNFTVAPCAILVDNEGKLKN